MKREAGKAGVRDAEAGSVTTASMPARRPTIRDVSRLAEVSRMTVSRAISEPDSVTPEKRRRVQQAIAHLGYVPDRAAGSLTTRRSGFVGLMLPTLTNANFSMVAHGLTEVLRTGDYHLLIAYNDYSLVEEEEQIRNLLARRPEAIVLTGPVHSREVATMLMRSGVPVIEVADLPMRPLQHAIGFSNFEVGRLAARYLLRRGLTRIGAVASQPGDDLGDTRGEERIRGFEDELRNAGIGTDLVLRQGQPPVSYSHGAAAIATLLDRAPDIEGVFAVSDLSAVGALMECQRRGVAVPDQLSIIGFGDFEIGREVNPPLSTIQVDFHDLGARAGNLVLALLSQDGAAASTRIDVGLSVIERASVRAPG